MSRPFAAVESFLERILERPAARLFHAHPQPIHLERRIERVMVSQRMVRGGHTYVPSRYRIILNPSDLDALLATGDQVSEDLADAILQRARAQGYWLVTRPEVRIVSSPRVTQGELEVDAEPLDPTLVSSAAAGLRPVELAGPKPPKPPIPGTGIVPDPVMALPPLPDPEPPTPVPDAPPPLPQESVPPPVESFLAASVLAPVQAKPPAAEPPRQAPRPPQPAPQPPHPAPDPPQPAPEPARSVVRAVIEVQAPEEAARQIPFEGGSLGVGRGADNEIVLTDARVSRHHGRFLARHGVLVYSDLDSTNGSLLNGVRVREAALGVGDVVRLGRTTLTVRPSP